MERLNFHIFDELQKENEVFLVGPKGADAFCADPTHVWTSPPLPVWRFLIASFLKTLYLSLIKRPQLIIAGSGVAALPAVLAGRLAGVPVLTYLHGLDIIARSHLYQYFFLPTIRRSQGWLVNSRNTKRLAINAGIPAEKIKILHPGTDLPDITGAGDGKAFRSRIEAMDRSILLSVGRLTRRKGLLEFIEHCLPTMVQQIPDVLLVVIGCEPFQSVAGVKVAMERQLIERVEQLGFSRNVLMMGNVDDRTLSEAYTASQLLIFPVLDFPGDVEGFGMVAVEAAAHGLPTVAFACGGVPDSVETGVSGWLIEPKDYSAMAEVIVQHLLTPNPSTITPGSCRQFAEKFAWSTLGGKLNGYCRQFIGDNR